MKGWERGAARRPARHALARCRRSRGVAAAVRRAPASRRVRTAGALRSCCVDFARVARAGSLRTAARQRALPHTSHPPCDIVLT
eukprot:7384274-Prymnesium_polylepis.1